MIERYHPHQHNNVFKCSWHRYSQLCLFYIFTLAVTSQGEFTAATYLHNIDIIIQRQLENPVEEDAHDIKDNVDEYIKIFSDLIKSIRRKDPVGLQTAKQYWAKGMPQFFQEDKNGDIFNRLRDEFNWPTRQAREVTSLIDKAKFLWSSFESWYLERNRVFRQF